MYQITFLAQEDMDAEPQTIRAKDYRILVGGVLELDLGDDEGSRRVQFLAPPGLAERDHQVRGIRRGGGLTMAGETSVAVVTTWK